MKCSFLFIFLFCSAYGVPFQHGFNFLDAQWGGSVPYGAKDAVKSLVDMKNNTNANWIAMTFLWYIPNMNVSGPIAPHSNTPSDAELTKMVQEAHSRGFKVKFRPGVNLDPSNPVNHGHWRGQIGTYYNKTQWSQFFANYEPFITHYAKLGQKIGIDQMCVGLELVAASTQEAHWRHIVHAVRGFYKGPLSYDANHGNSHNIQWWDAVDRIGIDAYYTLDGKNVAPSVNDLVSAWKPIVTKIAGLSHAHQKKVHFSEIGYCSTYHTNDNPAACYKSRHVSMQAQVNCYTAFFEALWDQEWFEGVFWWSWSSNPTDGGNDTGGYTVQHKAGVEKVVKKYYSMSSA